MGLKGVLNKEIVHAGNPMKPRASVMGVLGLAVAVMVVLAALSVGKWGYAKGKGVVEGLLPGKVKEAGSELEGALGL